jgi:hypothetical protein
MNTRLKSKTNILSVFRNRLIIIFLNIKKYYFKFFGFGGHILTQYALSTFRIKNRKNNAPQSLLNIYSVVDSTNILCIQYQHSNFPTRFKV